MAFDAYEPFDGRDDDEPREWLCKACRRPILDLDEAVHIDFQNGSAETRSMSGYYHSQCSRPFRSLAAITKMSPWGA